MEYGELGGWGYLLGSVLHDCSFAHYIWLGLLFLSLLFSLFRPLGTSKPLSFFSPR